MTEIKGGSARGTAWRIWDLHVHTPASIIQQYGANDDEVWDKFISDLEALPPDLTVIGINDYWFLEGYEKITEAKGRGRLSNLEAIFPVVEMRLDRFGGTDGKLSRINLHVIFDPDLGVDLIRAQFLGALQSKVILSADHDISNWQGVITRDSLAELGRKIKATVPPSELTKFGSDLVEGFNNLNVRLEDVRDLLERPHFKGRALLSVGKTEWNDMKWNQQSIAAKKTVINSADLIFSAYPDISKWKADVERFRSSSLNYKVLDCSDAHYFSDSNEAMRLGACQTWINTTPTFAGLAYAIGEFDRRVYVGLEPPALSRIRQHPERFIEQVSVKSESPVDDLFDHDLPLNPGFVAVVGNKGQGKSALLDCIALGGNSSRQKEFAFLSAKRFLSPTNRKVAEKYSTEVAWATSYKRRVSLTSEYDGSAPVSVEYLPQMFVERVCNGEPGASGFDEFEAELRAILFTHIPEAERAGRKSFDDLLAQKSQSSREDILRLREELRGIVRDYVDAVAFEFGNSVEEVSGRLELKRAEVAAAEADLDLAKAALEEMDQQGADDGDLTALRDRSREAEHERAELLRRRSDNDQSQARIQEQRSSAEAVVRRARKIASDVDEINTQAEAIIGGDAKPLLVVTIDESKYDDWRLGAETELERLVSERQGIEQDTVANNQALSEIAASLAAADSARERARQHVLQSKERVRTLIGDEDDEESQTGLTALIEKIQRNPERVDSLRQSMFACSERIYNALEAQLETVRSMYAPASSFISGSDEVKNAGLEFSADFRFLPSWEELASSLDRRRNGDFTDWLSELPLRMEGAGWDHLGQSLKETLNRLGRERGEPDGEIRDPEKSLRGNKSLFDFLVSLFGLAWLEVRFGLTGDGQPLSQLSPGQRGLILALFYLVVDQRTTPLLLDQPEENLDNETIASKLVPAIHKAAGRRQTIVVTHNANLAIVGDADQIVHCQMRDKRFKVSSGSIADLGVAQFALDVLEGTKPAFDNRRNKYDVFPALS